MQENYKKDEYNVFSGILGNWLYLLIQSVIVIGQIILVTFGGRAVRTHALTVQQHCYCILISSLTIVWGFLVKLLPIDVSEKSKKMMIEEKLLILIRRLLDLVI